MILEMAADSLGDRVALGPRVLNVLVHVIYEALRPSRVDFCPCTEAICRVVQPAEDCDAPVAVVHPIRKVLDRALK